MGYAKYVDFPGCENPNAGEAFAAIRGCIKKAKHAGLRDSLCRYSTHIIANIAKDREYDGPADFFAQLESATPEGGYDWDEWAAFADYNDSLDYGCRFNDSGGCNGDECWETTTCCDGCADNYGYLQAIPPGSAGAYAADFDESRGFLRSGGCCLPPHLRSGLCDTYTCNARRCDVWEDEARGRAWGDLTYYSRGWTTMPLATVMRNMRLAGVMPKPQLYQLS